MRARIGSRLRYAIIANLEASALAVRSIAVLSPAMIRLSVDFLAGLISWTAGDRRHVDESSREELSSGLNATLTTRSSGSRNHESS